MSFYIYYALCLCPQPSLLSCFFLNSKVRHFPTKTFGFYWSTRSSILPRSTISLPVTTVLGPSSSQKRFLTNSSKRPICIENAHLRLTPLCISSLAGLHRLHQGYIIMQITENLFTYLKLLGRFHFAF